MDCGKVSTWGVYIPQFLAPSVNKVLVCLSESKSLRVLLVCCQLPPARVCSCVLFVRKYYFVVNKSWAFNYCYIPIQMNFHKKIDSELLCILLFSSDWFEDISPFIFTLYIGQTSMPPHKCSSISGKIECNYNIFIRTWKYIAHLNKYIDLY